METKIVEMDLIENKNIRDEMIEKVEVLDKVKNLLTLPNTELMTTKMVAEYYEVTQDVIRDNVRRNNKELEENGMQFKKYNEIKDIFGSEFRSENNSRLGINKRGVNVFSKRAVLNIGMLLRDSEVAKRVRTALLDQQEIITDRQKTYHIEYEKELALKIMFAQSDGEKMLAFNEYNTYKNRHIEKLESTIQEQTPKVESFEMFMDGSNHQKMNQVAKSLGIGRNKLFAYLRKKKILMLDNTPYQRFIDNGYFKVKEKSIDKGNFKKNVTQTYVTAKGINYISKILNKKESETNE